MMLSLTAAALAAALSAQPASDTQAYPDAFSAYSDYNSESELSIDYSVWSGLLSDIVFDVGMSDRRPARAQAPVRTGTRLRAGSNSPYRNEGNRIIYHLIEDDRAEAISEYRAELIALADSLPISRLNGNEQLAFWLNLHNVILIDELIQAYPEPRVNPPWSRGSNFFDRPVATLNSVEISLNDIQAFVIETWDDPRVIYGFHLGAIGGPSITSQAFAGNRVWNQLNRIGREYVNSLRGVGSTPGALRVSALYTHHQDAFDSWPADLHAHLLTHAQSDVEQIIRRATNEVQTITYASEIADLTNGRNCGSAGASFNVRTTDSDGNFRFNGACDPLPPQAAELIRQIQLRQLRFIREGRYGRVTVTDIPTPSSSSSSSEEPQDPDS